MKKLFTLALMGVLSVLTGCSAVKLADPETPREKLGYAVAANAAIRLKADGSVQAKTISPTTGGMVLSVTDASRRLLNVVGSEMGVPVADAKAEEAVLSPVADNQQNDTIDQLVAEAVSARVASLPIKTVSTMIEAAQLTGKDLNDEAMMAIYGMDDDARAGLVKTLTAE